MRVSRSKIMEAHFMAACAMLITGYIFETDRQEGWILAGLPVAFALYRLRDTYPTKILWVYTGLVFLLIGGVVVFTSLKPSFLRFVFLNLALFLETFLQSHPTLAQYFYAEQTNSKKLALIRALFLGLTIISLVGYAYFDHS
jgi:hypothetical protein